MLIATGLRGRKKLLIAKHRATSRLISLALLPRRSRSRFDLPPETTASFSRVKGACADHQSLGVEPLRLPFLVNRTIVRAEGTFCSCLLVAFSARRRRVVHSLTTRNEPRKP